MKITVVDTLTNSRGFYWVEGDIAFLASWLTEEQRRKIIKRLEEKYE
ncbi:hypothetical protein [Streptococcus acidominimus]|uniref:Uncharacterized protein n=1 Tax=Streptococcus acidominimus TaxID=1326 RepID=A0A380JMX6_STRAI|nr:hypothetical protein [Streptococcus acidominimus]QBX13651.1 hypothetical protein Javan1_0011 [Streptococcus phage Javan1]SUN05212.1 Uncharacterised protein [Streptococcus acidominimus]SUN41234.1 Uncharacterised protein [Streptococcus acidominimus]